MGIFFLYLPMIPPQKPKYKENKKGEAVMKKNTCFDYFYCFNAGCREFLTFKE